MATVGSFEAKTHLSALLDRVAKGERITITKHGVPVAVLIPPASEAKGGRRHAIEALQRLGRKQSLKGISIRELIEKGRRF
jgi:prevent-host-death family protein